MDDDGPADAVSPASLPAAGEEDVANDRDSDDRGARNDDGEALDSDHDIDHDKGSDTDHDTDDD